MPDDDFNDILIHYDMIMFNNVVKYVLLKSTAKNTLRIFWQKLTYFSSMIYSQSSLGALGLGTQPRRKCRTQPIIYHYSLAGSPLFERKSSRKPKCNSFGAIFYILGRLFLYMHCLLPLIPLLFKTFYDHPYPWLKVQTLISNLHMTPVLLN